MEKIKLNSLFVRTQATPYLIRGCGYLLLFLLITSMITPYYAAGEENHMKAIFFDTFYGMAAGALIATAVSMAQDNPDWGENVGTGAAIGGIAGALFGIATEMRYFASVENGQVYVSVPSIGLNIDKKEIASHPSGARNDRVGAGARNDRVGAGARNDRVGAGARNDNSMMYTAGVFQYKF